MADGIALDLVEKNLVTSQIVLTIGYDIDNLTNPSISKFYSGEVTIDRYGRKVPKHAHGTINLDHKTSSSKLITEAAMDLYKRIMNEHLLVRRVNITANNVVKETAIEKNNSYEQMDLFTNYEELNKKKEAEKKKELSEREIQKAILNIKKKHGKNAIFKGMDLQEGGTTIERNGQIGGHKE